MLGKLKTLLRGFIFRYLGVQPEIDQVSQRPRFSKQAKSNVRNASYNVAEYGLSMLVLLVATPLYLKYLGDSLFGVWILVNSVLGFSEIFSMGMGRATTKYVSKHRALKDEKRVGQVIQGTWAIYLFFGGVGAVCLFFLAPWLTRTAFSVEADQLAVATMAFKITAFGILIRFTDSVLGAALEGYERYDYSAKINAPMNIGIQLGRLVLVMAGFSLVALAVCTVVGLLIKCVIKYSLLRFKLCPHLRPFPSYNRGIYNEVFSFGLYSWLTNIFTTLRFQGDTYLIGVLLGTEMLAYYTVANRALRVTFAIMQRGFAFLFPLVSKLYETQNTDGLRNYYERTTQLLCVFSAAIVTPMGLLAHPMLELWVGTQTADATALVMQILAVRFAMFPLGIVNGSFLMGANMMKYSMYINLFNTALVLGLMVLLAHYYGLVGAALAQCAVLVTSILTRSIIEWRLFRYLSFLNNALVVGISVSPLLVGYLLWLPHGQPILWVTLLQTAVIAVLSLLFASAFTLCGTKLIAAVEGKAFRCTRRDNATCA